jgi:hypothetical protein
MTSSQNAPKRGGLPAPKGRRSIKTLVATASLAATLGGWAMLASDHEPLNKALPTETLAPPRIEATSEVALGFPPLPTLLPPPTGFPSPAVQPTQSIPPTPTPLPPPTLRMVNVVPPQKIVHVGGGGGNGGSGSSGGGGAAAQTSSSR